MARFWESLKDTRRKETRTMTKHKKGTREEWLAARLELLKAEKELTRRSDELARRRQELPWVRIDREYRFETDEGSASLADLFRGRSQLLVYHFMFGPDYKAGCPACSAIADGFNGFIVHLANHDVMVWAVCLGHLLRSCRSISGGWGGRFHGRPRSAATSTLTSTSGSPTSNSAREASNTTTSTRQHGNSARVHRVAGREPATRSSRQCPELTWPRTHARSRV